MSRALGWSRQEGPFVVKRLALFLSCLVLLLVPTFTPSPGINHAAAATGVLGVNLIVNGDAEGSLGVTNDTSVLAPTGWTASPGFTVVQYGASGGFPTLSDPGPVQRGKNFFAGGPNTATSTATQQINLPTPLVASKRYLYTYHVSGYFGGYADQHDYATLSISFISATSGTLGSRHIGGVTPQNRTNQTSLLLRSATGYVPSGTQSITVVLTMVRFDGSYNDGYADNLSLVLRRVPNRKHYKGGGGIGG
jgi:hypothetical protein